MKQLILSTLSITVLSFNIAMAQPEAAFEMDSDTICLEETVVFTDLSTCNGCNIVGWVYDLGDGQQSNVQNPSNQYWAPGMYTIQLIVEDDNGVTDTAWQNLVVRTCEIEIGSYGDPCCPFLYGPSGFAVYSWSNGATTQVIQACAGGIYELLVIDAWGYELSDTIDVGIGAPDIVIDTVIGINCLQNNVGSISTTVQGGAPPYSYWLNEVPISASGLDSITYAGWNVVVILDQNGCGDTLFVEVGSTSNLYISTNSIQANCSDNGSASVIAQGQNPPYTYLWNDPNAQTSSTATSLGEGHYQVIVEDVIGCQALGSAYVGYNCYNFVIGRVYYDEDQNCVFDGNDYGIPNQMVWSNTSNGSFYSVTDSDGYYELHTPELDNEVSVVNSSITVMCPPTQVHNVQFNSLGDTATSIDFGLYTDSTYFDLDIHPGWTSATPGFDKNYWILFGHEGFQPRDVTVRFVYDPALTYLYNTQGGIHDAPNHTIEWFYPNYLPQGWDWADRPRAYFNVPASMEITDSLCSYFEILPISGDMDPSNNTLDICEPVTGSRDPNAKSVIPAGQGPEGFILPEDTTLFYTIHFQNNGNDTAFTVVVIDTLSQYLNVASIVPGAASHPYTFDLSGQGVLTFRFDEILLPDSTTNEPESHGYFNFTINLKPNLPLGTVIENTVGIYFDFNEPIITNTTVNTIHDPMSVTEFTDDLPLELYPNPTDNIVTVVSPIPLSQAWLTDIAGKRIMPLQPNGTQWQANLSALPAGIYLIEAFTQEGTRAVKKVVRE